MSDLSIYLTEEFKERMSQFNDNWAAICRKAIEAELLRLEAEKEAKIESNQSNNWVTKRLDPETFKIIIISDRRSTYIHF